MISTIVFTLECFLVLRASVGILADPAKLSSTADNGSHAVIERNESASMVITENQKQVEVNLKRPLFLKESKNMTLENSNLLESNMSTSTKADISQSLHMEHESTGKMKPALSFLRLKRWRLSWNKGTFFHYITKFFCFYVPEEDENSSSSEAQNWPLLPSVVTWYSFGRRLPRPTVPVMESPYLHGAVSNHRFDNDSEKNVFFDAVQKEGRVRSLNLKPAVFNDSKSTDHSAISSSSDQSKKIELKEYSDLKALVVDATEPHSATIIWLHSLGDSGKYFANEDGLDLPDVLAVPWCRFIFPTAAEINVTLRGGMQQPAWFDIERLDERGVIQDEQGVVVAAEQVMRLVANERRLGIPANRIILAGFGQVGMDIAGVLQSG